MRGLTLGLAIVGFSLAGAMQASNGEEEVGVVVVNGGTMFVQGERVESPYAFTLEGDTLCVNGRALKPLGGRKAGDVAVGRVVRDRHTLVGECFDLCEALRAAGVCRSAVRDSVIRMLEENPLVESAHRHGTGTVRVEWNKRSSRDEYLMIPLESPVRPMSWDEVCRKTAGRYADYLAAEAVIVVGAGGEMILPVERRAALEREIELLYRLKDPEADDIEILSAEFAREFLDVRRCW